MQRLVEEVGRGHQGARVNHGGEVYLFNGYRPKTVHGLYGIVTVLRAYYASSTGKGLAPLTSWESPMGTHRRANTTWPTSLAASRTRAGGLISS